ncbi:hypothetical protein SETIT_2G111800v2 [Setaria italica]|uniref:Knottin scorpion toxin-like domain-containing protein n=1 Tax=Setaria italica TaxID=4555 RepID=A0A368PXS2_SETIT|nr:hypothetical protein SETIT_2G111800v2 [Setaria italica]
MRISCTLLIVVALVVQYSGIYLTLPVNPGPCAPASCSQNCRNSIGYGSVGECVSGGCQCTYCAPSKPK